VQGSKVDACVLRICLYCEQWTRLYCECQLEDSLLARGGQSGVGQEQRKTGCKVNLLLYYSRA